MDKSAQPDAPKGKKATQAEINGILARRAKGISKKEAFRSLMTDIEDLSAPDRASWQQGAEGQKRNKTFDSTAIQSRTAFANRIQSDMMPPFQKWVVLKPGEFTDKDQLDSIKEVLDDASNKFYAAIQASNFDTAINEFLQDLAAGTAILLPEDGDLDSPINFYAVPPATAWIEEGAHGKITATGRDFCLRVSQISATWSDAVLTTDMNNNLKRNDQSVPENEYNLFEVCCLDPKSKKWYYKVIDEKSKKAIVEREYDHNRFIVVRWSKMSGETWGRGPLVNALPDIKTINKLVEMILRQAALRIAGVWSVANDGVINTNNVVITPGATIPVARNGGPNGPSISNIAPTGDIQVAELEREKLTSSIKSMLFDEKLPPDTAAVRSATEIMQRVKELVKDIGAPFGRLMSELIRPLVQRVLDRLYHIGALKHRIVVDGLMVTAQVISPLAQQQSLTDVENLVRAMQIISSFGNEALAIAIKVEDAGAYIAEKLGVENDLIRTNEERAEIQKMAAQATVAQNAQAAQGGGTVPGIGGPQAPAGVGGGQGKTIQVA